MAKEIKSLNEWRRVRGLDVTELAQRSGVGVSLGNFLYKGTIPKATVALKLAEALGVDMTQIQWGKEEEADEADLPAMPKSPPFDPHDGSPVVSDRQMDVAVVWAKAGKNKQQICEAMGVSRMTFYKALERYEAKHGPVQFRRGRVKAETTGKPKEGGASKRAEVNPSKRAAKGTKTVL